MTFDPGPEDRRESRSPLLAEWIVLFLAGPVIWYFHFWIVYLVAEAVCAAGGTDVSVGQMPLLTAFVVAVTAIAVASIWWLALRAGRRQGDFARIGAALGVVFVFATALVGLSALFLSPC